MMDEVERLVADEGGDKGRLTTKNMIGRLCLWEQREIASRMATWAWLSLQLVRIIYDNQLWKGGDLSWRRLEKRV